MKTVQLLTDITGVHVDSGVVRPYGHRGQVIAVADEHATDLVRAGHGQVVVAGGRQQHQVVERWDELE